MVEVEETADTPMECALQKLEPYRESSLEFPIIAIDTAVYFDGQETNPTHVKRAALAAIGKTESECSQEEIAQAMINYYKDIAHKAG
jgi:inosine/xanthosine triphosphate pyrophosphatase family protein